MLSLLAIILLSHGWYKIGIFPLTVFGFVPIFLLEHYIRFEQQNRKLWLFVYGFIIFFGWNIACIWWVWNATAGGAIAAFFINSLPMILPLILYSNLNKKTGNENKWFFISAWISLELLQFHWDFAFPWLILGNAFAYWPNLVQWYEYTGVLGGSLYCLLISFAVFKIIVRYNSLSIAAKRIKLFNLFFFYFFSPVFLSYFILNKWKKQLETISKNAIEFIVVQPNIDPYGEKFGGLSPMMQLERMLQLAEKRITKNTKFIVLPETALQGSIHENEIEEEPLIIRLRQFLNQYPEIGIISGADTYRVYEKGEKPSVTARTAFNGTVVYDSYNTAIYLSFNKPVEFYHKNKLVPGVEKMPYPEIFKFLEKFAIGLGGTSGSLGSNGSSKVFYTKYNIGLAPIICYESAFAKFTASYVNKEADVLVVITNDGWWGNTPGYKQHHSFSQLRAIENRRFVVRSANTGISSVIDLTGNVLYQTNWWQQEAFNTKVNTLRLKTFYTRNGDLVGNLCLLMFVLGLLRLRFNN